MIKSKNTTGKEQGIIRPCKGKGKDEVGECANGEGSKKDMTHLASLEDDKKKT